MNERMAPGDFTTLRNQLARQPHPVLFATLSGAHLYGFASPDSDYDLRGVHVMPLHEALRLDPPPETRTELSRHHGAEIDLVTHDVRKFLLLLRKRNGYVLEQLFSPLVIATSAEHEELKVLSRGLITKGHSLHYLRFAENQWNLFLRKEPRRVKPLLYVFRTLLTGIHLMRSGEVEADLRVLNQYFRLPWVDGLVKLKWQTKEESTLEDAESVFYRAEMEKLQAQLVEEAEGSRLPTEGADYAGLDDFLFRVRMRYGG